MDGTLNGTLSSLTPEEIRLWVVSIVGLVLCILLVAAILRTLALWRRNLTAETQLVRSEQAEHEVRACREFTDLLAVANARGGYQISESIAAHLLKTQEEKSPGEVDPWRLNDLVSDGAIIVLPVGKTAQEAAIAAIGHLAKRHEGILKPLAVEALHSLSEFRGDAVRHQIEELEGVTPAARTPSTTRPSYATR